MVHKVLIYVFKVSLYNNYLTVATTESVAFNKEMWCDSYVYISIYFCKIRYAYHELLEINEGLPYFTYVGCSAYKFHL